SAIPAPFVFPVDGRLVMRRRISGGVPASHRRSWQGRTTSRTGPKYGEEEDAARGVEGRWNRPVTSATCHLGAVVIVKPRAILSLCSSPRAASTPPTAAPPTPTGNG